MREASTLAGESVSCAVGGEFVFEWQPAAIRSDKVNTRLGNNIRRINSPAARIGGKDAPTYAVIFLAAKAGFRDLLLFGKSTVDGKDA